MKKHREKTKYDKRIKFYRKIIRIIELLEKIIQKIEVEEYESNIKIKVRKKMKQNET